MPIFETLPVLTLYQAVGLMLFIGLFHGQSITPKEYDMREVFVRVVLAPWITLLVGWFIGSLIF